ncbi:MAG TPA: DegT/DnrJ/EryC1/StrS aminotransferase family protein [Candidatus Acidoferrales bacterium]|nr:DegT/DnrJ/EryC1/StrS aminotransferase family protein [Candidatus Acidoferrales bacterium]
MATTTTKSKTAAAGLRDWPLMQNNIARADLDAVIQFLRQEDPILTQSQNVAAFEEEWSKWLGVKYSVFVNSGSSANQITLAAIRERFGAGEIIVPTLTWVSDIAAVLQNGFTPVFVDINPRTLGMDTRQVIDKISGRTRAVFLTHVLGYNALDDLLLAELRKRNLPLIEDVCESHGATFQGRKLGSFGFASNFSFYYAHHLSTIEGGMVCTDDPDFYEMLRMFRSHGMVRESKSNSLKKRYQTEWPDLNPDFIFAFPAYNVRSTEINAVLGRSQLKRLDQRNKIRTRNLDCFLDHLDPAKFFTDFERDGSCNYAFTLVLREPDRDLWKRIETTLRERKIEFRRGTSGGGNQLRQPFLRRLFPDEYKKYPRVNHVHFFGAYIGNYPELSTSRVRALCDLLNRL